MKLGGGRHRDTTQVKGLSPEITNVSEAYAVHEAAGRTLIAVNGEVIRARRGLRPCQVVKESIGTRESQDILEAGVCGNKS